jgi:holliday junction DNA helicase RuvA
MIAHLRGRLLNKNPNLAIIEAGGVGYELAISVPTFSGLPALNTEVALHVHTHVREDALSLYGFLRHDEKQLFEKLIAVSGIGPKLAITILSGMEADAVVSAIRGNNTAVLTRIPGIGKKTAERMVLELRDKLGQFATAPAAAAATPLEEDVMSALLNLGYQRGNVERALAKIAESENAGGKSFDSLFRQVLINLSK